MLLSSSILRRSISRLPSSYNSRRLVSSSTTPEDALEPSVQLPVVPQLERDTSYLQSLFSKETIEDIYVKYNTAKLDDLKFAIDESPRKETLESYFVDEQSIERSATSSQESSTKSDTDFFDNYVSQKPVTEKSELKSYISEEYYLETNNPIIDQYYKVLKDTAKKPSESFIFQNASNIYNSYYFFSSLKPNTDSQIEKATSKSVYFKTPDIFSEVKNVPTPELLKWINSSFGSLKEFKTLLFNTSLAARGSGYTWLLLKYINPKGASSLALYPSESISTDKTASKHSSMVIVNTYNSGVPHQLSSGQLATAKSFHERRKLDLEEAKRETKTQALKQKRDALLAEKPADYAKIVEKINQDLEREEFAKENRQPKSEYLHPDFPILTLEKALEAMGTRSNDYFYRPIFAIGNTPSFYLRDYGVYGKEQYLENVWNHLDWEVLEERLMGQYKKSE